MAGRGRLSSIDLLPEEAADDIAWAVQQLAARSRSQEDIRFELNDRLEAKGLEGISKSAFNRKAMRLATVQRRMQESRALFEGIAPQFTAENVDEGNIVLGELIKTLIQEILVDDAARDSKSVMELSRAYQSTISAMKISSERRAKLQAELDEKLKAAAKSIDQVGIERGFSADTIEAIKAGILGVRT